MEQDIGHPGGLSSDDGAASVSTLRASIPDAVFVFGSNLAGRHGKGAALWARNHRGAIYGQGSGLQGNSYAIPTKGYDLETLPLSLIGGFVAEFLEFARKYWMRQFQLTPIGCGLAGYSREQIEPLFRDAPCNIIWPPEWSAQAIEAQRVETEGLDAKHESAVPEGDVPNPPTLPAPPQATQ